MKPKRISQSSFKRAREILSRKAKVVLGDSGYDYYSLLEFSDGSHYPIPMLSSPLKLISRFLPVVGIRGVNWNFECPVCSSENFFTFRGSYCPECDTDFSEEDMSFTLDEYSIKLYFKERVVRELREHRVFQNLYKEQTLEGILDIDELRELEKISSLELIEEV